MALHNLKERVTELLGSKLLLEELNGIQAWINQAGVDTRLAEVWAKIDETGKIVRFAVPYNVH